MKLLIALALCTLTSLGHLHAKKIVFSDMFIFRMNNSVYSLDTLKNYQKYLNDLKCFYPESLVVSKFAELLKIPTKFFDTTNYKAQNDTKLYKDRTQSFITLLKMVKYSSSQSVSVSSDLPKAFKLSAQKNGCSLKGFEDRGLKEELANIVLLEVFLRSRFMTNQERTDSVMKNIKSLSESVRNQIDHELFEN